MLWLYSNCTTHRNHPNITKKMFKSKCWKALWCLIQPTVSWGRDPKCVDSCLCILGIVHHPFHFLSYIFSLHFPAKCPLPISLCGFGQKTWRLALAAFLIFSLSLFMCVLGLVGLVWNSCALEIHCCIKCSGGNTIFGCMSEKACRLGHTLSKSCSTKLTGTT